MVPASTVSWVGPIWAWYWGGSGGLTCEVSLAVSTLLGPHFLWAGLGVWRAVAQGQLPGEDGNPRLLCVEVGTLHWSKYVLQLSVLNVV